MGMELIRRSTVVETEAYRNQSLEMFGQAFDLLQKARQVVAMAAPSVGDAGHFDDAARDAIAPKYGGGYHEKERRERFLDAMRRQVDCAVWHHLIGSTDLEKLMDHKARAQFREQLKKDPPPATADNCFATMRALMGDADAIFKRGIAEAFSRLDRRFRSHDGFKVGNRIVLDRAFSEHGCWNHYRDQDETLRDVERAFCVLDGTAMPARSGGIIGAIDSARRGFGVQTYTAQNQYFRVRVFKNGNAHVYFLRDDLVTRVNKLLAEYYGEVLGAGSDVAEAKPDFIRTPARNYGFFETPVAVAERVLQEAGYLRGKSVLEPNAGRGALASKAVAAGAMVTCVEIQQQHAAFLRDQGIYNQVIHDDFFDQTPDGLELFDVIIMNPPFDGQRDIDHVTHAARFLKPGGKLVAIMAAGVEFRDNAKAVAFRALHARMGGSFLDLPAGSFAESGTMVNTIIAEMHAPRA